MLNHLTTSAGDFGGENVLALHFHLWWWPHPHRGFRKDDGSAGTLGLCWSLWEGGGGGSLACVAHAAASFVFTWHLSGGWWVVGG